MIMRVYFNGDMNVEFEGYYIGYPTKVMIPADCDYYELNIVGEIIKSIEELSDVHAWLIHNIGEYQFDWDMYHFQNLRSDQTYSFNNIINQYYIRFRYEESAIAFKLRWL